MKIVTIVVFLIMVGVIGGGAWWYWQHSAKPTVSLRLAQVKRGDVLASIPANATAEPEEVVDVGAQVAGLIDRFGVDPANPSKPVDYRTHVEVGTVLAHIDESLYTSDLETAQSGLAVAQANLEKAKADMGQMKAKLIQAQHDWDRAQKLGPSQAMAQSDYDMYEANYGVAKANIADQEAVIAQYAAAIGAAKATLKKAEQNIGYCTIASPVKGEIIDRRVNVGQTVVSSLSAPSLFLIAKDLKRMQVWASVNEADIGNIYPGQPVTFAVDAYSGRIFHGDVSKVRLNATMVQNVVTYTVEINTENEDGKLLPYMTCNVQFELARRQDVLTVPSTALRYLPQAQLVAPEAQTEYTKIARMRSLAGSGTPRTAATRTGKGPSSRPSSGSMHSGTVWVADGTGLVKPVKVTVGITDGINTEVQGEGLTEGLEVIVGEMSADAQAAGGTNPFMPQMPGRGTGTAVRSR